MAQVARNIGQLIGNTPLVRLNAVEPEGVELYGKLEMFNPGGSVKDRIGIAMLEAAEAEGRIEPGKTTIVEATSGNTGIALALVCACKGYELAIFLPQGMSRERESLLRMFGARVEVVESLGGMNEAVLAAQNLAGDPEAYLPDQFSNPANPDIHRTTTAVEILDDLEATPDIFVAGIGTGGTITGVGEAFKERDPSCQIIGVEPRSSAVISGRAAGPHRIQGIGAGFVPEVFNRDVVDEVLTCSDDDAIGVAHRLAMEGGILAGMSCGAAVWAAVEVGRRPENKGKKIVAILPDSGERYISAPFFAP